MKTYLAILALGGCLGMTISLGLWIQTMLNSTLISDEEYLTYRGIYTSLEETDEAERIIHERTYMAKKDYLLYKIMFLLSLIVYGIGIINLIVQERKE